jgi:hypothetical protein
MTAEPIPARLVRGPGPCEGRILCGRRGHDGHYWCRGVIERARHVDDGTAAGRWEAYREPDFLVRRDGPVPEGGWPYAPAIPVPFTRQCPNPSCKVLAIVDMAVLSSL